MNPPSRLPRATYRWQFHKDFTFQAATRLVPYLHALGISHVYASPFFRASPGSQHGYDICDHNELNAEVGSMADFDQFVAELRRHDMGLIVDFVPNHMGIADPRNQWWRDVLENGPASPYARFFDVDWHPLKAALANKVLLPILGEQYGRVLEGGQMHLCYSEGLFTLDCQGTNLPLDPQSLRPLLRRAVELAAPAPDELVSILTALDNLPAHTETQTGKSNERTREKNIIRDRLARLVADTPAVLEAIHAALKEWNDPGDVASLDRLDALLTEQPYRLSYWRVAAEEINYRRFFDINTLAAICVELPEVFEATHSLLLNLVAEGKIDGVRLDHIDGLALPAEYLQRLQTRMAEVAAPGTVPYLVVEKILARNETLPPDWPIHGSTGYEFANQVLNVLIDTSNEKAMTDCYEKAVGTRMNYREVIYRSKRLIMQVAMASEVNVLGTLLSRLAESNRWYRDFTVNALTTAVREVIACFSVYRSYLVPGTPPAEADVKVIRHALAQARRRNPTLERSVLEFIRNLLLPPADLTHTVDETLRRAFVLKFQQCASPVMAKGVEDTAFYIFNRHIALNEVGGNPGVFGTTPEQFHKQAAARLADFPDSMLATSTHDTKRSEDVRARIAALSELPKEWSRAVQRWRLLNRRLKKEIDGEQAPDDNEEFFLYQTLLGTWPSSPMSADERAAYVKRIQDYMTKVLHEAKVNSSWIEPQEAWDRAVVEFVAQILTPHRNNRFHLSLEQMAGKVAELGAVNSLAQTVLKLTIPGVPDFYQGSECCDLSLVDPDNRRPVDYARRQSLLQSLDGDLQGGAEHWRDDRTRCGIIKKLLHLRKAYPDLFARGSYQPLVAEGAHRDSCLAFERVSGAQTLHVIVPRLSSRLGSLPMGAAWQDTQVAPAASRPGAWRNVLTGSELATGTPILLAEALRDLPVAVFISE